jgi:hypothetical protein
MPKFRVLINDNAHYMDESERSDNGVFATAEAAVAACKAIVDDELSTMWQPAPPPTSFTSFTSHLDPILLSCRSIQKIRM